MSKRVNQGADLPAFPCSGTEGVNPESLGITVRQHAAIEAMKGLLANPITGRCSPDLVVVLATRMADALIAELEK